MKAKNLKISIITVTYNAAEHLQKSLDSILMQDYSDYESIVVDGGSVDGTIDILKEYEQKFQGKMTWTSEPDKGIFDAMNKGIKKSTGDVIGFLFDEYYNETVLSDMAHAILQEDADGVHGDLVILDGDKVVRYWKTGNGRIQTGWMAAHPTLYLKKEVYQKYGDYDISYPQTSDYEFEVRALHDGTVKLAYVSKTLIKMFYGGASTGGLKSYYRSFKQSFEQLKKNGVKHPYWITIRRTSMVVGQFVAGKFKKK